MTRRIVLVSDIRDYFRSRVFAVDVFFIAILAVEAVALVVRLAGAH